MELLPISIIQKHMNDHKLNTSLNELESLANISGVKSTDEQFDNELQVYSETPGVQVGADVKQYYGKANSDIDKAVNAIKYDMLQAQNNFESVHSYEETIRNSNQRYKELGKQIREARADYNKTMPFSKEAKSTKERIRSLKKSRIESFQRTREIIRKRDKMVAKINEKKQAIKDNQDLIKKRVAQRTKMINSVRSQFQVVDSVRAQEQVLKSIDASTLSPAAIAQLKSRQAKYLSDKNQLKISLVSPLKLYTDKDLLELATNGEPANETLAQYKAIQDMFSGQDITTLTPPLTLSYDAFLTNQRNAIETKNTAKMKHIEQVKNLFSAPTPTR